jgi:predicted nucleic acid-binding protein
MPFVIDASVAACWLLPDEAHDIATAAFSRLVTDHALVPSLWWFEMRNLFIVNERRGRLDHEKTSRALALLSELPIRLDHTPDSSTVLQLARRHRLTVYDAAYLELAQRDDAPLATLDDALTRAAKAEGVPLVGSAG